MYCKFVFKIKHNWEISISRYKKILVAKGYVYTHGIDYEKTFSLIVKMAIIRSLVVATSKTWVSHQMDVKNTFLHCELQEEACF